jgi:hypothetical protein
MSSLIGKIITDVLRPGTLPEDIEAAAESLKSRITSVSVSKKRRSVQMSVVTGKRSHTLHVPFRFIRAEYVP